MGVGVTGSGDPERTLLGHPRGLFLLFATEAWERVQFYGMRAFLVLFLVDRVHGLGVERGPRPQPVRLVHGTLLPEHGGRGLGRGSAARAAAGGRHRWHRDDARAVPVRAEAGTAALHGWCVAHRWERPLQGQHLHDGGTAVPDGRSAARQRLHHLLRWHQSRGRSRDRSCAGRRPRRWTGRSGSRPRGWAWRWES